MAVLKANGSFLKANGKILVRPEGGGDFVVIGGRAYPFVQIGRLLWIIYNLDYSDENILIGNMIADTNPRASYYNDDSATFGWDGYKCGLLYNWYAVNYLNENRNLLFPEGWRVPSHSDYDLLFTNPIEQLKSENKEWFSNGGTNETEFSALPSGRWGYTSTPPFRFLGTDCYLFTSSSTTSDYASLYYIDFANNILGHDDNYPKRATGSLRLCKDATVNIGGRDYPTTKIGNQIWLAENLDFAPDGITIGSNAWYYNNDETTYGYRGLLYSWNGVSAIIDSNLLPSGWRVPTKADFENLVLAVGSNAAKKLKASSFGGTDDFGFSILNAGYHYNGVFGDSGTGFWTTSNYSSSAKDASWFYNNSDSWSWDHITFTGVNAIPIRLVKDA